MSKSASTIAAKPNIDPALQWIGGAATNAENEKAGLLTSQLASLPTSQQSTSEAEVTAMLSVRIPKKLIQRLRVRAATEEKHIQDIVAEVIGEYLGKE